MEFTADNLARRRLLRYTPILLPIALFVMKMSLRGTLDYSTFGFEAAFIGVTFDIWALMTLFAERRVLYGGIFDMPGDPKDCSEYRQTEGMLVLFVTLAHVVCAAFFSRPTMSAVLHGWWLAVGMLVGVLVCLTLPVLVIEGFFLPARLRNAA